MRPPKDLRRFAHILLRKYRDGDKLRRWYYAGCDRSRRVFRIEIERA